MDIFSSYMYCHQIVCMDTHMYCLYGHIFFRTRYTIKGDNIAMSTGQSVGELNCVQRLTKLEQRKDF